MKKLLFIALTLLFPLSLNATEIPDDPMTVGAVAEWKLSYGTARETVLARHGQLTIRSVVRTHDDGGSDQMVEVYYRSFFLGEFADFADTGAFEDATPETAASMLAERGTAAEIERELRGRDSYGGMISAIDRIWSDLTPGHEEKFPYASGEQIIRVLEPEEIPDGREAGKMLATNVIEVKMFLDVDETTTSTMWFTKDLGLLVQFRFDIGDDYSQPETLTSFRP